MHKTWPNESSQLGLKQGGQSYILKAFDDKGLHTCVHIWDRAGLGCNGNWRGWPQSLVLFLGISLSRWSGEFICWQNLKLKTRNAGLIQEVEHRSSSVPPSGC